MDALRVEIQAQRYEVHVACPLAVSEERAFDAVGAGHLGEFGGGNCAASVVVRVQRYADLVALGDVLAEVLDLVGVYVWR